MTTAVQDPGFRLSPHTAGAGLLDDLALIVDAIVSRSWVDATLGVVGGALDGWALAANILDVPGMLGAWAVSWVIESVQPLTDVLDKVGGDPPAIVAAAQRFHRTATVLDGPDEGVHQRAAQQMQRATEGLRGWDDDAADAWRARLAGRVVQVRGVAGTAWGLAVAAEGAAMLVAGVRSLIRDTISQLISTLLVRLPLLAAAQGVTLGAATPFVVAEVRALCREAMSRIESLVRGLTASGHNLNSLLERLRSVADRSSLQNIEAWDAYLPVPTALSRQFTATLGGRTRIVADVTELPSRNSNNDARLVIFDDGSRAIYKPVSGEEPDARSSIPHGEYALREVAAYRLDVDLGLELVPPTVHWDGPNGPGSLQEWVQEWVDDGQPAASFRTYSELDQEKMAVFDYISGNTDRTQANYLTGADSRPVAIDNGFAFPDNSTNPIKSEFVVHYRNWPLDPDLIRRIRLVNWADVKAHLRDAGLSTDAVDGALQRLREIQLRGTITGESWSGGFQGGWSNLEQSR